MNRKPTYIHPTALVASGVKVGQNCYIGPYCVIAFPAEHRARWQEKSDPSAIIGDNTIITGMVTIDAGLDKPTKIGKDCFIMKQTHIGHDATIGDKCTLAPGAKVGGHANLMDGVYLSMNSVVHPRHIIGAYSVLGMGAVAPLSINYWPVSVYVGNPAELLRRNTKAIKNWKLTNEDIANAIDLYQQLLSQNSRV